MKKLIFTIFISILSVIFLNENSYSANEQFRSAASGNWNLNSTWEMSTDGGFIWFAATSTPRDTSGTITLRSPNTVTVTVNVNADQLVVNSGATLSINNLITLTILDGSGEDLLLNSGGIISGAGTLQTQGAGTLLNIHSGSSFTAVLKVNTGTTSAYDSFGPFTAFFSGPITVDVNANFAVNGGGYSIQANNNVTNNGNIIGSGGTFKMRGAIFTNNDTINTSTLNFDSTTSLAGTGAYRSGLINISSSGNVSLANNVTFSPASSFTVNGTLNPNTKVFTQNSGSFVSNTGSTISNSGTFQTQGTVSLIIRNGSNFNAPLKVNTGNATAYNDGGPFIAIFKGTITVDAGSILTVNGGGYYIQANNNVTNNGTITGSNAAFIMRGATLTNTGTINVTNLNFDSTTTVTGNGSYSSNTITIGSTGHVSLSGQITFSPASNFTINSGGIFTPSGETFTFTSGTFTLEPGATVQGVGVSAGTLRTLGNVVFNFKTGAIFNSNLRINSGTLLAYNSGSPFVAVFSGIILVDAGATLQVNGGGYTTQANNNVTNNGTISGSGSTFTMRGPTLTNNGSFIVNNLRFDSTTSLAGTGSYTSSVIVIGSSGNVSLANNVTFSPTSTFTINSGGVLNPNTRIFTFNSGSFFTNNGSTVSNSGTFQTQNTVSLVIKNGSNFNAPLKVNTGITTTYDDGSPFNAIYKGTMTVDAGATLTSLGGGYIMQANNTVTNNGTITTGSGSTFRVRGLSVSNNSQISGTNLSFDSTTSLSGTGSYTSSAISIGSSGNVSLANNVTFSPGSTFDILGGGILNPNSVTFTLASGAMHTNNGSTVTNSGTFQTQNSVNLIIRAGSSFNVPLKVNTGIVNTYDDGSPFTAVYNGTITVDTGAIFSGQGGGYAVRANNNITNNGTLTSGGGTPIRFFGTSFTNNGIVTAAIFNFESGAQTLQGTGSWGVNANVLNGSTVTLASNHKMLSVTINAGGTFNVSTFKLSLTGSNPISNGGTFNTTTGTVEYNGTSLQSISTTNVTYNRLRINNSAGTSLSGNVTVSDTLSDILGHLNLNGFILTISPTGYLTETSGNTINGTAGYITTTRTLNAPSSLNVGGLGAVLTTAVNLGSTEIRRGHAVQSGLNGNTSILRYFDITPTTNTGLNGTLVYKYDDSELNGKTEGALQLFRSTNTGSTWTAQGGTVNTVTNSITLSGIGAFSRWSASSASSVAAQLKVIIEGYYNTSTGKLNIRDTVRAYLRNITAPYAIVDSALSVIDSVTFSGNFNFVNAVTGTYYIQTKQRNSIETWSKTGGQAYTLGSALIYDFTTSASQAFGNNETQVGSKFCVFSGDVLQDGFVDLQDVVLVFNDASNFVTGYVRTDLNGDRTVDLTDLVFAFNNSSAFVHSVTP